MIHKLAHDDLSEPPCPRHLLDSRADVYIYNILHFILLWYIDLETLITILIGFIIREKTFKQKETTTT